MTAVKPNNRDSIHKLQNFVGNRIALIGRKYNRMEVLVEQISKGQCKSSKVSIKKNYINEDPTKEETVPCPQCSQRNLHHMVRYLYLNFKEAIYKCEASDCMYPFKNFKYKNYDDNTVYHYQPLSSHTSIGHVFDCEYSNNSTQGSSAYEPSFEHIASVDFDLDFLSSENGSHEQHLLADSSSQSLQQFLNVDSISKSFDTKFIDDILTDLLPSPSDHLAPSQSSTLTIIPPGSLHGERDTIKGEDLNTSKQNATVRKLEKCLKAFQTPIRIGNYSIFKKPSTPNSNLQPYKVENLSPTRLRIKKLPLHRAQHSKVPRENYHSIIHNDRTNSLKKAHALVKKKSMKPLEFLHTLNSLSGRKVIEEPAPLKPKRSSNPTNVQKMLSFIKRSMKNRDHKDNCFSETSDDLTSPKSETKGDASTSEIKPLTHSCYAAKTAVEARTFNE
uniref:Uncharacterized protein n=1 Tax=Anopheles atroparvus TaxID=41427 RepID=A0AAG5D197_ANOAO